MPLRRATLASPELLLRLRSSKTCGASGTRPRPRSPKLAARLCGREPSARPLVFSLRSRASARRCSAALVGLRPRLGCCARPWRASLSPARSGGPGPLAGLKAPRFAGRPPARPGSASGPSPAWGRGGCGASSPPSPPGALRFAVRSALRGLAASPRPPLWSGVPASSALGAPGSGWGAGGCPLGRFAARGASPARLCPAPALRLLNLVT